MAGAARRCMSSDSSGAPDSSCCRERPAKNRVSQIHTAKNTTRRTMKNGTLR